MAFISSFELLLAVDTAMERFQEQRHHEVIGWLFKRVVGVVEKYLEANTKKEDCFRRLFVDFLDTMGEISTILAFQAVFGF